MNSSKPRKKADGAIRDQWAAMQRKKAAREAKELVVKGRQALREAWEADLEADFTPEKHKYVLHLRDRERQAKSQLRAMAGE